MLCALCSVLCSFLGVLFCIAMCMGGDRRGMFFYFFGPDLFILFSFLGNLFAFFCCFFFLFSPVSSKRKEIGYQ